MTTDTKTKELLRDLVHAFTMHPGDLELEVQHADGAALWMIKGNKEDEPFLVGKGGSHVRALSFLVRCIGLARREKYTFTLITRQAPKVRPPMEPNAAIKHDPSPSQALLVRILEELAIDLFTVSVGPGSGPRNTLTFLFEIFVRDVADYNALTVSPFPDSSETIVGALGTLFRAIAKKNGVRFDIAVASPS